MKKQKTSSSSLITVNVPLVATQMALSGHLKFDRIFKWGPPTKGPTEELSASLCVRLEALLERILDRAACFASHRTHTQNKNGPFEMLTEKDIMLAWESLEAALI